MLAALLASLAVAAPAPAEPVCHGQLAPATPAEQEQAAIEEYMRTRAEFGFRADEAYVRELIRRNLWETDVGYVPVTRAEDRYLRRRDRLDLGGRARRYLREHRDISGGWSIEDDWPRGAYILVRVTSRPALHLARLKKLVPRPDLLRVKTVRYSERRLDRIAARIWGDAKALDRAGFRVVDSYSDTDENAVLVELITSRTDHAAYFARYGPVKTDVIATSKRRVECVDAGVYEIARDGRSITLHWQTGHGAKLERVELVERPDRVEVGIVESAPNGFVTLEAVTMERRVALSAPLGDRAVIDAADGRRMLQTGPSPGDPACPKPRKQTAVEMWMEIRESERLPHGRDLVRRRLRSRTPYTKAERRYVNLRFDLEADQRIHDYLVRHADDYGGSTIVDRYPAEPQRLFAFTRRLAFHRRNLRRIAEHPGLIRVERTEYSMKELGKLARGIQDDAAAGDGFLGGYGHAGFLVDSAEADDGAVTVRVWTTRGDGAQFFRDRYGAQVRVRVVGERFECREAH